MAEKISSEQVKNIAKLAKLELTSAEVEKFSAQLSEVIDYNVKQLSKVDTKAVEPLLNVAGLTNAMRADEPETGLESSEALKNAKETHNGFIKVKAILEQ